MSSDEEEVLWKSTADAWQSYAVSRFNSAIFLAEPYYKPSLNLMLAWLPLQNGMLAEAPQRQSVTRFLTS